MSGKGGLMRWQAECGHWMVVHSLEPTPKTCPDCIDEMRKSVKLWGRGIEEPLDLPDEDVTDYFDDGTVLPDAALTEMTRIAQMCTEAGQLLRCAEHAFDRLLDEHFPPAERLSMESA